MLARSLLAFSYAVFSPAFAQKLLVVDLDDVGYDLLADTPTPTLDALAANGRAFTTFATSPLCSPTRAVIMTGAYSLHPDLLLGGNIYPGANYELPVAPLVTLPRVLSDAGFTTAKVGKWHLAPNSNPDHPRQAGFGSYAGVYSNPDMGPLGYFLYTKIIDGVPTSVTGRYLTTDETDDALVHVVAQVDFISVSYHAPHAPWHVPPSHLHSISPIDTDRDRARAMLQACDTELARLVRPALALGYTVIVHSDNGTASPIGGEKGLLRDGGIVVPFVAMGPGVVPGVDHTPIGAVDLYATVCDHFGVAIDGPSIGPHSRSFRRNLGGVDVHRRWTYSERFAPSGSDPRSGDHRWGRAVRGQRYKLISRDGRESLFDLVADPGEAQNLLDGPGLQPSALSALEEFRAILVRL